MRTLYSFRVWSVKSQFTDSAIKENDNGYVVTSTPSKAYIENKPIKPCLYSDYIDDLLYEAVEKRRASTPGRLIEAENAEQAVKNHIDITPLQAGERCAVAVYDEDKQEYCGACIMFYGKEIIKGMMKDVASRGLGASERYDAACNAIVKQKEKDVEIVKQAVAKMDASTLLMKLAFHIKRHDYMSKNMANGELSTSTEIRKMFIEYANQLENKARELGAIAPFGPSFLGAKRTPFEDIDSEFAIYQALRASIRKAEGATPDGAK